MKNLYFDTNAFAFATEKKRVKQVKTWIKNNNYQVLISPPLIVELSKFKAKFGNFDEFLLDPEIPKIFIPSATTIVKAEIQRYPPLV